VRDTAALLYGPYVLAALTGEKNFLSARTKKKVFRPLPLTEETLDAQVEKKDGLHFSVDGISFVPLCSIDKEKYQVYVKVPGKFEKMMGKTK